MTVYIIQEEYNGIPEEPKVFKNEADANMEYVTRVNECTDPERKTQNVDEAINFYNEYCEEFVGWYIRYWVVNTIE